MVQEEKIGLEDLRVGDIMVFPAPEGSKLSQVIALLTDSSVSHAALMYKTGSEFLLAESTIGGIRSTPLPHEEPYVRRYHLSTEELNKLLNSIEHYIQDETDYAYIDLVLLGILLVYKKFSKKTLTNKIFYTFLEHVARLLAETINNLLSKGKIPMVCSQYVAQCFLDAECPLKFNKMVVDWGYSTESFKLTSGNDQLSLITLLGTTSYPSNTQTKNKPNILNMNEESKIFNDFIHLIKSEKNVGNEKNTRKNNHVEVNKLSPIYCSETLDLSDLVIPTQDISNSLNIILTNKSVINKIQQMDGSYEREVFFVTPADLYLNCSNAEYVGQLSF